MSNRKVRVGELVKRELSDILHTRFKSDAVMITITEVDVSPDNKNALVLYSVFETKDYSRFRAKQFFDRYKSLFRKELGKRIILKYLPALTFAFDEKNLAVNRVQELIDELEVPEGERVDSEDEDNIER